MAGAAVLAGATPLFLAPRLGPPTSTIIWPIESFRHALRREAETAPEPVASFYRANGYRPVWVVGGRLRPQAESVGQMIERAADDGLDPAAYQPWALRTALAAAAGGRPRDLARAETALSAAYAAYVADLRGPPPAARVAFWDPDVRLASITQLKALQDLGVGSDLTARIASARRMHPIYEQLRAALIARRQRFGDADPLRPLILVNMARARVLPADPGPRYILVDAAAERLWLFENGRPVDTMKVIVGRSERVDQTPTMVGLMRYAQFRPYWNIPEDVTRDEIAPRVLREGLTYLERQNLEVLSDWSDAARPISPRAVDWRAVAAGATSLRVRRRPGPLNVLGQVKLMLPNPLGIYLHDTSNKAPFKGADRWLSHGCIRLEHAMRLTRRIVGPAADHPPPGDDARVDLPTPVPVFVSYFTVAPGPHGLERRPDVYGRDAPVLAQLPRPRASFAD